MAGYIPQDKIEEIQRLTDILELINQYVPLRRAGRNYVGLCPFHTEKTPSFTVSPEKQLYKCFGCGEGGTVFTFLMKKEGLSFPEATRLLAERANVEVPEEWPARKKEKVLLYEFNDLAAESFQRALLSEEGKGVRKYLAGRQIREESIAKFRLGYAPNRWDFLVKLAESKGLALSGFQEAGLILPRDGGKGFYDRFRNRLMFPISDSLGRVVGFGGRSLDSTEPKYLNSPETQVFSKGRSLYGVEVARPFILKDRKVLIMEGYTDVIVAHQEGIPYALAVLGTALSSEHIKLLRQWADKVVLVLDGDVAGQRSSERNLDTLVEEEIEARVVQLPQGYDPCDFLLERGRDSFLQLVDGALDFFSFKVKTVSMKWDLSTPSGKLSAIRELLSTVSKVSEELKRQLIIKRIAEEMSVEESLLRKHLAQLKKAKGWDNPPGRDVKREAGYVVERELVSLLLSHNELIKEFMSEVGLEGFNHGPFKEAARMAYELYLEKGGVREKDLIPFFAGGEEAQILADITMEGERGNYRERFQDCIYFIKRQENRRKISYTKERVRKLGDNQEEEERRLLREFHERNKLVQRSSRRL